MVPISHKLRHAASKVRQTPVAPLQIQAVPRVAARPTTPPRPHSRRVVRAVPASTEDRTQYRQYGSEAEPYSSSCCRGCRSNLRLGAVIQGNNGNPSKSKLAKAFMNKSAMGDIPVSQETQKNKSKSFFLVMA